jgi:HAMP domain-containing protein
VTTTASLDSTTLSLDAGAEAVVPLQIRNNGQVVEGYHISVLGAPAAWATVDPADVSLYPGTTTTATVTFRPPRSARTPAGEQAFAVKVEPTEHPELTVVPEGVLEVLPFLETTAELTPRTSQGRSGRHKVAVDNRGNVPVNALVEAASDGERVRFKVDPVGLAIPPGEAKFVSVKVKARKRIWRGQPVTHPFVVLVSPQDSTPVELDGSYVQTPVVPKWLLWALLGLLLLLGTLLALWFWLLKPTIESQAKDAAEESAQQAEAAAEQAAAAAQQAGGAANDAAAAADEAEATEEEDTGDTGPRKPRVTVTDISPRLNVVDGNTGADTFALPGPDDTFSLTDVVLSNPQGDFGRALVIIDGEVLLDHALENFRDLDFHFVSPIRVTEDVTLQVNCRSPGEPPDAAPPNTCDVSVLLGGELISPVPR